MNKKFTKLIAALALLVFMAPSMVGWGQSGSDVTLQYTGSTTTNMTGGNDASLVGLSATEWSVVGYKGGGQNYPGLNKDGTIRLYASSGNGASIVVTNSNGYTINSITTNIKSGTATVLVGGTEVTGTNSVYAINSTSFTIKNTMNTGQVQINSITINYTSGGPVLYTVTYDANGGTGTMTDPNSPYEEGDEVTLLTNAFTAPLGYAFNGWAVTDASSTPVTVTTDNTFTMPASNVTVTAQWQAYTITAQSNNTAYGTVSLSDFTITASPVNGYRVSTTTPYSVSPANSATVAQNGNTFTVTPTANTTVTINFEEIPTHTATFSVNGTTTSTQVVAEGAAITFPANPADIDEMVFMGWTNAAIDGTQSTAPSFVTSATMGTSDVTFYAVFASVTPGTATTVTDELTRETTGVTSGSTTYSNWSGKKSNSDAVYAGNSAGGNNSIQLRTNNNNSGVVTTTSGGKAKKVTITWNSNTLNGRILDIYGKNSAYSTASDLYNTNNQGTKLGSVTYGGTSTEVTITGDYKFIGMRSNDGAMYISTISIEWESVSPDTYSDYCTTVIIPTVAKPTFSPVSGEVLDGTVVTMSCTTEGATIYYSTDDGATWTEGTTYTVTENVTLKAKAVNGSDESQVVEATYTVQYILTVNMEHVEYFIFNYHDETWDDFPVDAEGRPLVHEGDNVRVSVASVEDCYTLQGLSVTFGENTIEPEYLEDEEYSFIMPASSATLSASVNQSTGYTLTVEGLENASFTQLLVGSGSQEVDLDNNYQATICEQLHVAMVGLTAEYGHVLESVTLTYGGQTTEITPESGVYEFTMPSSNATLTITTYEVALFTYTKVTSVTPGKHYIIVTESDDNQGKYHAMGGNNSTGSNPYMNPVEVNVDNNTVTVAENEGVAEILIADVTGGNYTLHTSEGYLAGGEKMLDINGTVESTWGISFDDDQAVITWSNTNYAIQYNSSNPRFACYSSSQAKVCLYEKNEYDLTINGYGSSTTRGWNLIASPVAVNPANVEGMTIENSEDPNYSNFDLYYFDQTGGQNGKEWKNYKANHFNLVPGTGYLYANKTGGNYTLAGTSYSGNGEVGLVYSEDNEDVNMRGWNLIGNPFNSDVTIGERDFYIMNDDHDQIILADANHKIIAPMQGIFVQAASVGESVTFTEVTQNANANSSTPALTMNLLKNRGNVIDRAIVRFGQGRQLSKFQLFENSTKLYFAQNNEEMAVVRTEAQGEMPVSFRAAENGTYTLTVNPEGVDMNYLHLIDNMTGADVDLLATPSYTFNATTRDYESRFRLVFAANNEDGVSTGSTAFAFYSNGTWVINNTGEATLQVVDVNGRILSSETVNGSVSKAINASAGVYMLRLINGNDVKTQKIVVR